MGLGGSKKKKKEVSGDIEQGDLDEEDDVEARLAREAQRREDELRREYDRLFADMEFRCKRAAIMNYYEAERLQFWSEALLGTSCALGALGVAGIAYSVNRTQRVLSTRTGIGGALTLPLSVALLFFGNGSSTVVPTMANRSKLHVQAGAGWQRLGRLTRSYRIQLRHLASGSVRSGALSDWYTELIGGCEQVSRVVPIRAETYIKFEQPESVCVRLNRREHMLQRYIGHDPDPTLRPHEAACARPTKKCPPKKGIWPDHVRD